MQVENKSENNEKVKNIHAGHRKRLRQELFNIDFTSASEVRVLESLLFATHEQKDVNPLAHALLDKFGDIVGVLEASPSELMKVNGVGEATVYHLASYLKVFKLYNLKRLESNIKVNTSSEMIKNFAPLIRNERVEKCLVLVIDDNYEVKRKNIIELNSSASKVDVDFNQCYASFAGIDSCKFVALLHNHPSGSAYPSFNDNHLTEVFYGRFKVLGKTMLDHIIVSRNDSFSYKDMGLLSVYESKFQTGPLKPLLDKNI